MSCCFRFTNKRTQQKAQQAALLSSTATTVNQVKTGRRRKKSSSISSKDIRVIGSDAAFRIDPRGLTDLNTASLVAAARGASVSGDESSDSGDPSNVVSLSGSSNDSSETSPPDIITASQRPIGPLEVIGERDDEGEVVRPSRGSVTGRSREVEGIQRRARGIPSSFLSSRSSGGFGEKMGEGVVPVLGGGGHDGQLLSGQPLTVQRGGESTPLDTNATSNINDTTNQTTATTPPDDNDSYLPESIPPTATPLTKAISSRARSMSDARRMSATLRIDGKSGGKDDPKAGEVPVGDGVVVGVGHGETEGGGDAHGLGEHREEMVMNDGRNCALAVGHEVDEVAMKELKETTGSDLLGGVVKENVSHTHAGDVREVDTMTEETNVTETVVLNAQSVAGSTGSLNKPTESNTVLVVDDAVSNTDAGGLEKVDTVTEETTVTQTVVLNATSVASSKGPLDKPTGSHAVLAVDGAVSPTDAGDVREVDAVTDETNVTETVVLNAQSVASSTGSLDKPTGSNAVLAIDGAVSPTDVGDVREVDALTEETTVTETIVLNATSVASSTGSLDKPTGSHVDLQVVEKAKKQAFLRLDAETVVTDHAIDGQSFPLITVESALEILHGSHADLEDPGKLLEVDPRTHDSMVSGNTKASIEALHAIANMDSQPTSKTEPLEEGLSNSIAKLNVAKNTDRSSGCSSCSDAPELEKVYMTGCGVTSDKRVVVEFEVVGVVADTSFAAGNDQMDDRDAISASINSEVVISDVTSLIEPIRSIDQAIELNIEIEEGEKTTDRLAADALTMEELVQPSLTPLSVEPNLNTFGYDVHQAARGAKEHITEPIHIIIVSERPTGYDTSESSSHNDLQPSQGVTSDISLTDQAPHPTEPSKQALPVATQAGLVSLLVTSFKDAENTYVASISHQGKAPIHESLEEASTETAPVQAVDLIATTETLNQVADAELDPLVSEGVDALKGSALSVLHADARISQPSAAVGFALISQGKESSLPCICHDEPKPVVTISREGAEILKTDFIDEVAEVVNGKAPERDTGLSKFDAEQEDMILAASLSSVPRRDIGEADKRFEVAKLESREGDATLKVEESVLNLRADNVETGKSVRAMISGIAPGTQSGMVTSGEEEFKEDDHEGILSSLSVSLSSLELSHDHAITLEKTDVALVDPRTDDVENSTFISEEEVVNDESGSRKVLEKTNLLNVSTSTTPTEGSENKTGNEISPSEETFNPSPTLFTSEPPNSSLGSMDGFSYFDHGSIEDIQAVSVPSLVGLSMASLLGRSRTGSTLLLDTAGSTSEAGPVVPVPKVGRSRAGSERNGSLLPLPARARQPSLGAKERTGVVPGVRSRESSGGVKERPVAIETARSRQSSFGAKTRPVVVEVTPPTPVSAQGLALLQPDDTLLPPTSIGLDVFPVKTANLPRKSTSDTTPRASATTQKYSNPSTPKSPRALMPSASTMLLTDMLMARVQALELEIRIQENLIINLMREVRRLMGKKVTPMSRGFMTGSINLGGSKTLKGRKGSTEMIVKTGKRTSSLGVRGGRGTVSPTYSLTNVAVEPRRAKIVNHSCGKRRALDGFETDEGQTVPRSLAAFSFESMISEKYTAVA
ncbi:hypothetical protein HDU67_005922 [Dinochytrium kinnereticum]|nr:hypothetical protein HDU67_005922 [Dinochytrium kinnereticum]